MLFSTYEFALFFLPFTLIVYFLLGKWSTSRVQHVFLVGMSLYFYAYFKWAYLYIILSSIFVNYAIATLMQRHGEYRRVLLLLGIFFNVGLLGYFKYTDFLIENINYLTGAHIGLRHILLPLGISFFTFQQFSFILGVYHGTERVSGFVDYCLFVTFFPQLIAGPIVLYGEMMPQFLEDSRRFVCARNIATGIYIFSIGLFKKLVLADTVALFADNGFALEELGFAGAWATSLSYSFQIYFDFSGYCDMAGGIAAMFNIELPVNFNSPYKSKSITEFWRRWHMTLGRALAYYIYIPLGGNRKGATRTYLNLLATFFVSGLWHGAAWSFVIWGALHGVFSVLERVFKRQLESIPSSLRMVGTFLTVNFLWVLFRAESMGDARKVYAGMLGLTTFGFAQLREIGFDRIINLPSPFFVANVAFFLCACAGIVWGAANAIERKATFELSYKSMFFAALLFFVAVLHMSKISPFIYFNF